MRNDHRETVAVYGSWERCETIYVSVQGPVVLNSCQLESYKKQLLTYVLSCYCILFILCYLAFMYYTKLTMQLLIMYSLLLLTTRVLIAYIFTYSINVPPFSKCRPGLRRKRKSTLGLDCLSTNTHSALGFFNSFSSRFSFPLGAIQP